MMADLMPFNALSGLRKPPVVRCVQKPIRIATSLPVHYSSWSTREANDPNVDAEAENLIPQPSAARERKRVRPV